MKIRFWSAVVAVVSPVAFAVSMAGDVTVEWTSGETATSLSNGVVSVAYDDGGLVTNLTATVAAGDTVTISGDTLTMGEGATVAVEGLGMLAFTNVVDAQDGLLRLDSPLASTIDYSAGIIGSTNSYTLMFPGYRLDEYEPVMSDCGASGAEGMYNPNKMYPYHMIRGTEGDASVLSLQMQCYVVGVTKCVFMKLKQTDDGIAGGVCDAFYVNGDVLGEDFTQVIAHSTTIEVKDQRLYAADGQQQKGYGIDQLTMRRTVRPTVRFYDIVTNTVGGAYASLDVGASVSAESSGLTGLSRTPISVDETVDGEFVFRNRTLTYKNSSMTGCGFVRALGDEAEESPCDELVTNVFTKGYRRISNYRFLTELTNAVARFCGKSVGERTGDNNYGNMYHYTISDSGLVATGQFQRVSGKGVRCVYMEFLQDGFQCKARVYAAGYVTFKSNALAQENLGCDMPNLTEEFLAENASEYKLTTYTLATGFDNSGYGLYEITFNFKTPDRMVVAMDTPCLLTNSEFSVSGVPGTLVQLRAGNRGALPTNGVVNVYSNAELALNTACGYSGPYYSDQSCLMRIHAGGRLVQYKCKSYPFGGSQKIELLGGELQLGVKYSGETSESSSDCNAYVPFLMLSDGALVFGDAFRVGQVNSGCEWKVRGSSPSTCDARMRLTSNNTTHELCFDVYDVTGTDDADFIANGDMVTYDSDATHVYLNVKKVGDGTMQINGAYSNLVAAASVGGGTWLFGANGSAVGEPPFILDGGTLATAAATTNALGAITVSSSGALKVGDGGLLTFNSFAFGDEVARRSVQIDADPDADAIRCTATLTAAQLARFYWIVDDETLHVKQDENGFLRPYIPGVAVIIR